MKLLNFLKAMALNNEKTEIINSFLPYYKEERTLNRNLGSLNKKLKKEHLLLEKNKSTEE